MTRDLISIMCGSRMMCMPVDFGWTVDKLREKIEAVSGDPAERMKLILEGRRLAEGTLADNNVKQGSVVHVVVSQPSEQVETDAPMRNDGTPQTTVRQHFRILGGVPDPALLQQLLSSQPQPPPRHPLVRDINVVVHATPSELADLPQQLSTFEQQLRELQAQNIEQQRQVQQQQPNRVAVLQLHLHHHHHHHHQQQQQQQHQQPQQQHHQQQHQQQHPMQQIRVQYVPHHHFHHYQHLHQHQQQHLHHHQQQHQHQHQHQGQ
eukprot:TRINITY_DN2763_c0_g1_i3.p3 TRINITY_DN2763_c0_g1~~TRINITY_DN2763_c0_g1_i3.p3  ORF type:complete len:263 (+),score=85.42 TRINITY_DN2763_c0_g1_i3:45-833(+)